MLNFACSGEIIMFSSKRRFTSKVILTLTIILAAFLLTSAQNSNVQITVISLESPARAKIEGQLKQSRNDWSFRQTYAGVSGLAERIESVNFTDDKGNRIAFKKLVSGEYQTESAAAKFSYEIKLEPPADTSDSAYVSWLTDERGLFLTNDLLPLALQDEKTVSVKFVLPAKWRVFAVEKEKEENVFEVEDISRAVFVAGERLRKKTTRLGEMDFDFVVDGEWMFTDEEVRAEAFKVLNEYKKVWGGFPSRRSMFLLLPFPRPFGAIRWSAETRGSTVILLSGKMPAKLAAMLQLNTPLTHELFHLWLPNALSFDGQYDWFYEGFTLYQALRAGMRLDYFSFQDYMDSVARAYDAYQINGERDKFSLPDASKERWAGANDLIYNKGMLTAFLYDLTLRQKSKKSLDDIFRELFKLASEESAIRDGNRAVIEVLSRYEGMKEFVNRYIEKPNTIDLQAALAPFGLYVVKENGKTIVKVNKKLSRSESDLLKKLGYNETLNR